MLRVAALPLAALALLVAQPSQATEERYRVTIEPLPAQLRTYLTGRFWKPGCPVPLSALRLLAVSHWGFDGKVREGQLIVNAEVAAPLAKVFRRLHALRFPIRHMRLGDQYGPRRAWPADGDVSGSFHCRQAVPSPCTGGTASGSWSNHAYGRAVDLNPIENPYLGCGRVHDPRSRPYVDRTRLRPGMVTPAVVRAFRSIGWGWGGDWTGDTKDWMHFSTTGH
ncbi:MAG TPA: M15 family metallopeptidase [Gaiellaceae bacterium]|nr:M15 family metallopeptidase [Gaiellaceae bacterium]